MAVSMFEFDKTLSSLHEAIDLYQTASHSPAGAKKAFRDACILKFEYCIELAWKTSMKILGSSAAAAKLAIRDMARNNFIANPEQWFKFIDARNESSHSYNEEVATRVYERIEEFYPEALKLADRLRQA